MTVVPAAASEGSSVIQLGTPGTTSVTQPAPQESEALRNLIARGDRYLSLAEASQYLSISERSLRGSLETLPHFRFGSRKVLFKRSELDKWMERWRVKSVSHDVDSIISEVMGR